MADDDALSRLTELLAQSIQFRAENLNEPPDIEMAGDFGETLRFVNRTVMTPMLATGRYRESKEPVTIPLAHLHVEALDHDANEDEPASILRQTLTLENAALLAANLVTDVKMACGSLARIAPDNLEQERLVIIRRMAAHMAHEALSAIFVLNHMIEDGPAKPLSETKTTAKSRAPAQARPKVRIRKAPS